MECFRASFGFFLARPWALACHTKLEADAFSCVGEALWLRRIAEERSPTAEPEFSTNSRRLPGTSYTYTLCCRRRGIESAGPDH